MEKRRRERINRSLEELKNLILDQTNHNVRKQSLFLLFLFYFKNFTNQRSAFFNFSISMSLFSFFFYGQLSRLVKIKYISEEINLNKITQVRKIKSKMKCSHEYCCFFFRFYFKKK